MMGFATLIIAIAPAVGPSFGGFLVEAYGWRSIFLVLLPFLGLSLVLGALTVCQARNVEKVGFSPVQFLLVAAGFTALVVAANAASEGAWTSPKTLGLLALAFALLAGFTWISRRSDAPLLRVRIFADRTYSLSLAYAVLIQAAVLALGYLIPYFAQVAKSTGSFAAGCLLLPGCVIGAILTPFGGRLLDRFGAKRPILAGAAVGVATLACFAAFGAEGSAVRLAVIYAFFPICQGLSLSNSMTHGLRSARGAPSGRQCRLQHRPAARRRCRHGCGGCDRQLGAGRQLWRRGGRDDGGRPDGVLRSAWGGRRGIRRRPRRFSPPAARAGGEALAKRPA